MDDEALDKISEQTSFSYHTLGASLPKPASRFMLKRRSALNSQDDAPNARKEIFRHAPRSRRKVTLPAISMPLAEDEA